MVGRHKTASVSGVSPLKFFRDMNPDVLNFVLLFQLLLLFLSFLFLPPLRLLLPVFVVGVVRADGAVEASLVVTLVGVLFPPSSLIVQYSMAKR